MPKVRLNMNRGVRKSVLYTSDKQKGNGMNLLGVPGKRRGT